MTRMQKTTWNPALVALEPSHLSWMIWLVLSPFIYFGLEAGNYGFLLGLAVGLSFMQVGYAWGQYREHWWRFFIENRTAIFDAPTKNKPTKKIALTYVFATVAKCSFSPVFLLVTGVAAYALEAYLDVWRGVPFPFDLLIACMIGGAVSVMLTSRIVRWGKEKTTQLTDFSYVLESEPVRQTK
jgi:hypothetical protein